ncbi:hypothetical protein T03_17722 [Trichinella britovi]|uniref:Uncharacterized protein n=2 Tax=Trichinella TaxID=6333 RepID=A0A0V1DG22_TRIBR|nr:hypothetical protein T12_14632 [Trichinella patagoniensis]KRY60410.1 hypothetical protein T03_17722 [Trichinella britovi]
MHQYSTSLPLFGSGVDASPLVYANSNGCHTYDADLSKLTAWNWGGKNPVLCQAGLTVQPRTLAVLCATVDGVWLQFCFGNQNHQLLVEKERVNIFGDFVQQAEFYIFHFGISGKSPSPFGAYRQHKRSLTNRFFLTTRLSKEKGIQ